MGLLDLAQRATRPDSPIEGLRAVSELRSGLEGLEADYVDEAVRSGLPWSRVAQALGVSRRPPIKRHSRRLRPAPPGTSSRERARTPAMMLGASAGRVLRTPDPEGAKAFYGAVLGWTTEAFGPMLLWRLPGYVGGVPEQPVPRDVVAAMARAGDGEAAHWRADFWIADADAAAARATQLGGSVVAGPEDAGPFREAVLADADRRLHDRRREVEPAAERRHLQARAQRHRGPTRITPTRDHTAVRLVGENGTGQLGSYRPQEHTVRRRLGTATHDRFAPVGGGGSAWADTPAE
jgi:predicted enzyme related to lactoylglutathione lyase